MNLKKKLKLYIGLPLALAFLALLVWGWIQADRQQELWNTVHSSLTDQYRDEQQKKVLNYALQDYLLYSEFKADVNSTAGEEEYVKAKDLLKRLKAGERETLVEPTAKGLHLVKTWFPDPRETADQAVARFHKDYAEAGQATVPLMVMEKAFDEEWAKQ